MEKRVCIVGAGIAGLTTCKHLLAKGFRPIVFEAKSGMGGVWARTIASTRLQSPRPAYEFSDFPWPETVTDMYPDHRQVMDYLESYAGHFGLLRHVRFRTEVVGVEFFGPSEEEMKDWELWAGSGEAFGGGSSKGVWHVTAENMDGSREVHQFDFVILCMGRYSDKPNIPTFPVNKGPEVFDGKVIHSMDYADMGSDNAYELIKGKRVAVVGYLKSALDIAAECATANGAEYPCTVVCRTKHWVVPYHTTRVVSFAYMLLTNRFTELLVHKPGEGLLLSLLATFLSPLAWMYSKLIETYIKWSVPMQKYGMVPEHRFSNEVASCISTVLPDKFYDMVENGSMVLRNSHTFSFYKNGIIIGDDENSPIETDVVILGTGYRDDQKLRDTFASPSFQKIVAGTYTSTVPLYRGCIFPNIPQLAVVGYYLGLANLYTIEMGAKWVSHFLHGDFRLPSIKSMQADVIEWEKYMKRYSQEYFRRMCVSSVHIWYNDQLCRDIGVNPRRKKGFLADLFLPYGPHDYADL